MFRCKCLRLTSLVILESNCTQQNDAANCLVFFKPDINFEKALLQNVP